MILDTAKQHFDEDINRAIAIKDHANQLEDGLLKEDVLRAAWMMSVGACDAFFCDAYADVVSRTLRAKELQPAIQLPDRLGDLRVPVVAVLNSPGGWRWRMAARELIENENVLSLEKIKKLLNLFCRDGHKLMNEGTIESWIAHPDSRQRVFGISRVAYNRADQRDKKTAKKNAVKRLDQRMEEIFQRRHDCIHNCDRPRVAVQAISVAAVSKVIEDIRFLVERCCESIRDEFPQYLRVRGFNGVTRNRVGA